MRQSLDSVEILLDKWGLPTEETCLGMDYESLMVNFLYDNYNIIDEDKCHD